MASKLHTAWGVRHRVSSLPSLETTGQNKYMGPYDAHMAGGVIMELKKGSDPK